MDGKAVNGWTYMYACVRARAHDFPSSCPRRPHGSAITQFGKSQFGLWFTVVHLRLGGGVGGARAHAVLVGLPRYDWMGERAYECVSNG